jgi:phosphatidate cytidylyltransferase
MTDTGAYFTGRWLGRHKLIPWLSPNKTWEGLAGGIVVALLCAVGVGYWLHAAQLAPRPPAGPLIGWLALFGLLMAGLSVAGDLSASLLKRDAAVKDSGTALPGLGGILDVLDSPLLAAPVAWLFWTRFVQHSAAL